MEDRRDYIKARRGVGGFILPFAVGATLLIAASVTFTTREAHAAPTCEEIDDYGECRTWESEDDSNEPLPPPEDGQEWTEERWSINCAGREGVDLVHCADRDPCPEGEEYSHRAILARDWVFQGGSWEQQSDWHQATPWIQCRRVADEEITEEQVRRAVERFGMRSGEVEMAPPGAKTLVDFDTIVWTEQGPYEFELDVAGTTIELMASPGQYHWDFGDGRSQSYDTPGVAYAKGRPMGDYHSHSYQRTGEFDVSLTIDYHVRWNAGDGWQSITETISSRPEDPHTIQVVEKRNRLRDGQ